MNSIRPLVTITILVVVGVYLYLNINDGSLQPGLESSGFEIESPEGVPPLATSSTLPTTGSSAAPPWNPDAALTTAPLAEAAEVATADVPQPTPAMPAMPEVPAMAEAAAATPAAEVAEVPGGLPTDIPEARYASAAPTDATSTQAESPLASTEPNASTPGPSQVVAPPLTPMPADATTPEEMNAATTAAGDVPSPPLASDANPLRQSLAPENDRYATAATVAPGASEAATAEAASGATFIESWPTIQAALDRGELAKAHLQLSRWYGDPSLTPTDAERVETLLSQLAGTVLYSTEHRLGPAHVVKPGETLETIAKQYNVPWQLLAKINGMAAADQVRPGQELKVINGPFSAIVELDRKQLTLMLDGRYAGKFPLQVAPEQAVSDGEWVVENKSMAPKTVRQFLSGENMIVLRGQAAAAPAAGAAAPTLVIGSGEAVAAGNSAPAISVSATDAEELSDILSIGSRVQIRR